MPASIFKRLSKTISGLFDTKKKSSSKKPTLKLPYKKAPLVRLPSIKPLSPIGTLSGKAAPTYKRKGSSAIPKGKSIKKKSATKKAVTRKYTKANMDAFYL